MNNIDMEDLAFFYGKLQSHPLFCIEQERLSEFETLYETIAETADTLLLTDAMTELTAFFHDGHTNIELPYTPQDRCLELSCRWNRDRLVLAQDDEEVPGGAELLSIENRPIGEITAYMAKRIPHENIYLVRSRMLHYPYRNYHVFSEMNLRAMFGEKDRYEVCFLCDDKRFVRHYSLQNYAGSPAFSDDSSFISVEITDKTAILHLDSCLYNDTYRAVLDALAERCEREGLQTLILDLSRNMGGSSACIDEFIRHVDIDTFRRYEMIDYSQTPPQYVTRRTDIVTNKKSAVCFPKDIRCLVSHDTFSSARTFAVTLRDNGIAKIVGTPTGGKPNSFGMPRRYKTPNHGISFRVSTSLFLRPDMSGDDEISLFPDI